MFTSIILNKYTIGISLILAIAGSGFFYVSKTSKIIESQKSEIGTLKNVTKDLEQKKEAAYLKILEIQENISKTQKRLDNMRIESAKINEDMQKSIALVNDQRLKDLATKKSGLIEIKVNKATNEVFGKINTETKNFYNGVQQ